MSDEENNESVDDAWADALNEQAETEAGAGEAASASFDHLGDIEVALDAHLLKHPDQIFCAGVASKAVLVSWPAMSIVIIWSRTSPSSSNACTRWVSRSSGGSDAPRRARMSSYR